MHDVMAFASLYVGDSQTMAAEAGVLGVPFVRFNDFVGRIGYLRDLEDKYELGVGVHASQKDESGESRGKSGAEDLVKTVDELVDMNPEERKKVYGARRERMLAEKIDYAKFLTWYLENYPESAETTRKAGADFWKRFK